jgi:hypothetical protein
VKSDHRVEMNRQGLRVVQIVCILLALSACWLVAYLGRPKNNGEFGPIQWVIVLAAAYCAVSGFTFQRYINKEPSRSQRVRGDSTAFRRWSVGHLIRLASACSVAMWGAVIPIYKGPLWIAGALCGIGILLLLVWRPGTPPSEGFRRTV